jgi:uncharacterized protein (TIGR03437 family)
MKITLIMAIMAVGMCVQASAQASPVTVLEISVENFVQYVSDVSDLAKLATDPNFTTTAGAKTFGTALILGDITGVNGKPAKGTFVINQRTLNLRDAFTPGTAFADVVRGSISNYALEILAADDIYAAGFSGGPPPPGAPSATTGSSNAVVGGTGAFLGARGQLSAGPATIATRNASATEDPANRRTNGGGKFHAFVSLIPLFRPEVVMTPGGPAVTHSNDFSLVTASKPATAGENLSLFVTGLGPTRPGVDAGQPFPSGPLAVVNSPVEVSVNGAPAQVLGAVGFPGSTDTYQVNFQVPLGTPKGAASVQVTAAWIAGNAVSIMVQ